ncbi:MULTISPECIES: DUF2188 domain-containing protein [Cupriavidus]|jgi:hypothetical protein|uniref:DUF2188 domain-containing protein n=1 Tax=Cupriavidus pinatubonensis (strain JMP 134 / LMG 1197) TaxID=264198 RepID=Q46Z44_CUPPJ|nr:MULTISPECIES: DUF2188 domain-containing protein [Cupriavidus]QYY30515.1 DUF2188 domain-containing protein [Cupriavidus pinatubonensis]TPQ35722.1 DUF2188 domain-containing protein [Cupriavidus pinatubonensis]
MPNKNIHVVPTHNGWAVQLDGGSGNEHRFTCQKHAIATGTERARQAKVALLIHGRDGQIVERSSFETEALEVKD